MIRFDESTSIKRVALPTLVVAAENDPVTLPSASQVLTESVSQAYCVTIPMGKHQAQMEMNESFLRALKGFIRKSMSGNPIPPMQSGRAHSAGHENLKTG